MHTTAEVNALRMVIESRKFDINEPLIFHMKMTTSYWLFVIGDFTGMALLLGKGSDVNDPKKAYFLLVKNLVRPSHSI